MATAPPCAVHAPLVRLLTQNAELQRVLIRQLDKGRRTIARRIEPAAPLRPRAVVS